MADTHESTPQDLAGGPSRGAGVIERTRLAPSPTGALHLGNARTFLVNWALATKAGWRILLRIEDLDTPRVKPGAIEQTIDLLAWLGMHWDEGPIVQSADLEPYIEAMRRLAGMGAAYPSSLSRREIEQQSADLALSAPQEGAHESRFPPELRPEIQAREFAPDDVNWRLVVEPGSVAFTDAQAGDRAFDPSQTVGDFLVWTMRRQPSYQLAVIVDDAAQGVTQVVRGDDLLDSTARQILLARRLGLRFAGRETPRYRHLPLVIGPDGRRLAKRHGDTRLDRYRAEGVSAERVIGLCAKWCGIITERRAMDAQEFASGVQADRIPQDPVMFTQEDEQWLCQQ